MNKYLIIILLALGLNSCTSKDESYYMNHPKELKKALKACPKQQPQGLTCEQMQRIDNRLNSLGYQLQSNPLDFGNSILALQQTIAKQQIALKNQGSNQELKNSLDQNKHTLTELLAVIKWLESPESS